MSRVTTPLWQQAPRVDEEPSLPAWQQAARAEPQPLWQQAPRVEFEPIQPEPDPEPTINWGGRPVRKSEIERVAREQGVDPATIARLGTWQGRLESRLAKSAVGQTLLRTEAGISSGVQGVLSLGSRAVHGVANKAALTLGLSSSPEPFQDSFGEAIRRDRQRRADFLSFIERGSDIETVLGERGNRIYSGVASSIPKMAVAGLGGPTAVLSVIGAEAFDTGLEEAKERGLTGISATGYAGAKSLIETGVTYLMGKVGQELGITTMEEVLSPAAQHAVAQHVARTGITRQISDFMVKNPKLAGLIGAKMEAAEEVVIDGLHQMIENAISGGEFDLGRTVEAGMAGLMGGTFAHKGMHLAQRVHERIKSDNLAKTLQGIVDSENFIAGSSPDVASQLRPGMDAKAFEELTGQTDTTPEYRDAFVDAADYYKKETADPSAVDALKSHDFHGEDGYKPLPEQKSTTDEAPSSPQDATQGPETTTEPPDANVAPEAPQGLTDDAPPTAGVPGGVAAPENSPEYFAAKKAFLAEYGEELGIVAGQPVATREKRADVAMQAKQEGYPERAKQIAEDILANNREATRLETAGMVIRGADIRAQRDFIKGTMLAESDPVQKASALRAFDDLQREAETIARALDVSGSEAGRSLQFRKFAVPDDWSPEMVVVRAEATKTTPLTPKEREEFIDKAEKQDKASKEVDAVEAKAGEERRKSRHREVTRLRTAIKSIRTRLGLDEASAASTAVPALTDADKAELVDLQAKLREVDSYLDNVERVDAETDFVHNRPSEIEVSKLDDALGETRRKLKQKSTPNSEQVELQKIRRIEGDIQRLNDYLAGKTPPPPETTFDAMSKRRSELTQQLGQLKSKVEEVRRTKATLKRLAEAQEELANAKAGILKEKTFRADVMSKERAEAHYALQQIRREIRDATEGLRPNLFQHQLGEVDNVIRAAVTSYDLGALLRQANPAVASHPSLAKPALTEALRAWSDPRKAFYDDMKLRERPYGDLYRRAGLPLESLEGELTQRSEHMLSNLILRELPQSKSVPKLRDAAELYRRGIIGSQRAHIALLNRVRADLFDMMVDNLGGPSNLSPQELKDIAHFVSVATGRGGSAMLEQHMQTASHIFFSPRFMLSRVQYLTGQPMWNTSPKVRKEMAKEYVRSLAGNAAMYAILTAAYDDGEEGFGVSLDPNSSDFLKIRMGRVTLDPAAGAAQWIRLAQTINPFADKTSRDRQQAFDRFVKGKLSPSAGFAYNVATGGNIVGEPYNVTTAEGLKNIAVSLTVPLSAQELVPLIEEQGLPKAAVLTLHNLLGQGVQIYDPPGTKQKKRAAQPWD